MRQLGMRKINFMILCSSIVLLAAQPVHATISPQESVNLYAGNSLHVSSSQPSIKSVVVRGNLSAAQVSSSSYPARNFTLSTNTTQFYTVNVWLSYPAQYTTTILIHDQTLKTDTQDTSFYVSGGDLNLTIFASFQSAPATGPAAPVTWSSFYGWLSQFGNAFPLWVKVIYTLLAAQFAFVGYRWIKFEEERRRIEGHLPPLDRGNKIYLLTDIVFRALVAGFAITLAVMIGEVVVIGIAQYLFLVNLSLFSLVDFFSLFFVAALATIMYLTREGLERLLDLKPMMDD